MLAALSLLGACEKKPAPKPTAQEHKVEDSAKSAGEAAGKAATEGKRAADEAVKAAGEATKDMPKEE